MKKSSKRFTISSEAKNSYGFRVKSEGIDLTHYNNNPLLLWMHKRPKGERKDEILPLGFMGDMEFKDGKHSGIPNFDDTDDFAMQIYNKVENGTIKMCSAGLKPVEFETIDGEKWLTKSILQEVSLCDIGSNSEALAITLYDDNNEIINLADFNQTFNNHKQNDMKLIQLSAATLPLLKLKEDANEADAHSAILNLVTLSQNQETEIKTLKTEKQELQDKIDLADKDSAKSKVIALVDQAEKDRKITKDEMPHYTKLAEADFESTKALLDSKKGNPTVDSTIDKSGNADESLVKLSWKELEEKGKLVQLKEQNLDVFKEKFKEAFGADYKS